MTSILSLSIGRLRIRWSSRSSLTSKDGQPVPFTLYGRKEINPTDLLDQLNKITGSIRQLKISSGQTRNLSVPNLALFYDLTLPGEYTLTVSKFVEIGERPKEKGVQLQVEENSLHDQATVTAM